MRYIANLADYELFELLVSNQFYLFIFGALECKLYIIFKRNVYTYKDDPEIFGRI